MIHFDIQGTALFFQRKSCAVSEKSCIFAVRISKQTEENANESNEQMCDIEYLNNQFNNYQ